MKGKGLAGVGAAVLIGLAGGCQATAEKFKDDVAYLKRHTEVIVLASDGNQVAVCPGLQGRVMTSTVAGPAGPSLGYLNRALIARQGSSAQFNNYGGEDRLWLGPEGGPFSLYFPPGQEQEFKNWVVPEALDRGAWQVVEQTGSSVRLSRRMKLTNYSKTTFDLQVEREVGLLGRDEVARLLGIAVPESVSVGGYFTRNVLTNVGSKPMVKSSGLVSLWILGMFRPSPQCVVIVPFNRQGTGPIVKDDYFGKVPPDRLKIDEKAGVVLFRCDGRYRSKIGLNRARTTDRAGSIDFGRGVLTIVTFNLPADPAEYVNSQWGAAQDDPFAGDVVNSYNDGPTVPGGRSLGGFYELETSSPARELKPNESVTHIHRTLRFLGPEAALDAIAQHTLGVRLEEVRRQMLGPEPSPAARPRSYLEEPRVSPARHVPPVPGAGVR